MQKPFRWVLAFGTILSSNRSSFLRGYQPARVPSPPPLPLISLKKWSVLIYQSPLQTWTRRYSIIERTGHGDLDVSNGLISSFRGPSSLRGSHRKGKREAEGIREKKCKISCERYWLFSRLIRWFLSWSWQEPSHQRSRLQHWIHMVMR